MWAALFGLMFVCSTTILPGRAAGAAAPPRSDPDDRPALEEEVQIPAAFDLRLAHARGQRHGGGELGRDGAGRLPQRLGEVERHRAGEVPQRELRRPLEHDPLDVHLGAELVARGGGHGGRELSPNGVQHGRASIRGRLEHPGVRIGSWSLAVVRSVVHPRTAAEASTRSRASRSFSRGSARAPSWACARRQLGRRLHGRARRHGGHVLGKIAEFERGRRLVVERHLLRARGGRGPLRAFVSS